MNFGAAKKLININLIFMGVGFVQTDLIYYKKSEFAIRQWSI